MMKSFQSWPKFLIGWLLCFGIRLLPFRPANIEPVFATMMPFSRRFGALGGVLFVVLNFLLYDFLTVGIGGWTWVTAGTYAAVAIGASWYLKDKQKMVLHYVIYAIVGTLFYDSVTGIIVGMFVYKIPFMEAFTGQVPFTLNHLLGNIVLAAVASPLIDRWIVSNRKIEWGFTIENQ